MGRAAARSLGAARCEEGKLGDPEDVFYLTREELLAPTPPANAKELVAFRRERREEYLTLAIRHVDGDAHPATDRGVGGRGGAASAPATWCASTATPARSRY